MEIRIEKDGSFIVAKNTNGIILFEAPAKDSICLVSNTKIEIKSNIGNSSSSILEEANNFKDSEGAPLVPNAITWLRANMGFNTASGGSEADLYQLLSEKNEADGYAGLDSSSKINPLQLPALGITSVDVRSSEADQLALTVQQGDVVIRTDENKSYIALNDTNATMADWQEFLTPTDLVSTVFGRSGNVTAQNNDYTAEQIAETSTKKILTSDERIKLNNTSGTNTGDQASIVGISGTKAQLNTALTDGNFLFVGDVTSNQATQLSTGTRTATTYGITSDGSADDILLLAADTTNAGLLTSEKWDEIVANTSAISDKQDILSEGAFVNGDKTRLDNVENNADVTDEANVTAAGALMDSEISNLAQVKAFDASDYASSAQGLLANNALQNLSEDTTPQLGGELDLNGHSIGGNAQTATGSGTTTIDWKLGNIMLFQFGAFNETFVFTPPTKPGVYILRLVQDSVGSRTAAFPVTVKWMGGTPPTLTATPTTGKDYLTFIFDGTNYDGVESLNFS
jgi:hypothetical protein